MATCLVGIACTAASCGSDDGDASSAVYEGDWLIEEVSISGETVDVEQSALTLTMSEAESSIVGRLACNTVLGSFTFDPDRGSAGMASFTIPGSTTASCDEGAAALDETIVAVLESVTSWERDASADAPLVLVSSAPTRVELRRP